MLHTLRNGVRLVAVALAVGTSLTSCIDEDLSQCGKDYNVDYQVQLHTSVNAELSTELVTINERALAESLGTDLSDVFTDRARDLDLGFYSSDDRLVQHGQHQVDASSAAFTLYLPVQKYTNLSLANMAQEPLVTAEGFDNMRTLTLQQADRDTIDSQRIGLFSARQEMAMEERDSTFHVDLYMQNCTSCLVVDPGNVEVEDMYGYATGFATSFNVCDSVYHFERKTWVRQKVMRQNGLFALYATTFPSHNRGEAVDIAENESRAADDAAANALWRINVYIKLKNGKTTENILYVREPLRAGQMHIVKARLRQDGGMTTTTQNVGVSVKLDWKPGGEHDIEI